MFFHVMKLLSVSTTIFVLLFAPTPAISAFPSMGGGKIESLRVDPEIDSEMPRENTQEIVLKRPSHLGALKPESKGSMRRSLLSVAATTPNPKPLPVVTAAPPIVFPKYNPLKDAKCFNDVYHVPNMTETVRESLYDDYVKIFRWGLLNDKKSPLYSLHKGVTRNRFPGMCIRMAYHDNTIDPNATTLSAQQYVADNIQDGWWDGPQRMETSGGDASILICPAERLHHENDYDQSASRVLHAFQSAEPYPYGPGIVTSTLGSSSTGLMEKYGMSYADALHNCALAAITFLTESQTSMTELDSTSKFPQSDAVDKMVFGRLDACHVTIDPTELTSTLEYNHRIPLCGNPNVLPGVNLDANEVNHWFKSRGMAIGAWVALFGSHTLFDNFGKVKNLRNLGLQDEDYFEDYIGCPFIHVKAPVEDPEDSGCLWQPQCNSGTRTVGATQTWPMARSDCATGEFFMAASIVNELYHELPERSNDMYFQTNKYVTDVGSWIPDFVCGMTHFGGPDSVDCVGPNSVKNATSDSLFGSTFTQNPYPGPVPSAYVPGRGEIKLVGMNLGKVSVASDGTMAAVDANNNLWMSTLGEEWTLNPTKKALSAVVIHKDRYLVINTDEELWSWDYTRWVQPDFCYGDSMAVSSDGSFALIELSDLYLKSTNSYDCCFAAFIASNVIDVAKVNARTTYYVNSNGNIFRTTNQSRGTQVGTNGVKISASEDGTVVMIDTDGSLWQKTQDDNTKNWFQIMKDVSGIEDVAVMNRNSIFFTVTKGTDSYVYRAFSGQELRHAISSPTASPTTAPSSSLSPSITPTLHPSLSVSPSLFPSISPTLQPTVTVSPTGSPSLVIDRSPGPPLPIKSTSASTQLVQVNNTISVVATTTVIGGFARTISAGSDGTFATTNTENRLWTTRPGSSGWTPFPAEIADVGVVQNNQYYMIDSVGRLFVWINSAWSYMFYDAKALSASWDGTVAFISKTNGMIWFKTLLSESKWAINSSASGVKDVALVGAGIMYYIASSGEVFRTTSYVANGIKVGIGMTGSKISASKDGTVVLVSTDGTVWQKTGDNDDKDWIRFVGVSAVDVAVVDMNTIYAMDSANKILRINK